MGTVLAINGDIKYPRLRVWTREGSKKNGYCSLDDLPQMQDVWAPYSQWEGRECTPQIERLIPKYPLLYVHPLPKRRPPLLTLECKFGPEAYMRHHIRIRDKI